MSNIIITYAGPLKGETEPPTDKSISHRAIIFSSLSEGKSVITNFLKAEDPLSTVGAFRQMGIDIEITDADRKVIIKGRGLQGLKEPDSIIDCGNSGTTMRLMSGVLAGQPFSSTLSGDQYLLKRPMKRVIKPLSDMGANISATEGGYPPLKITGTRLKPTTYHSPIASAQVKSAVLLAGLYCDGVTGVIEPGKSRDHTERMLSAYGADITVDGLSVTVKGNAHLRAQDMTVPGDLSSAAFFITAALIVPGSEILIKNTGINPTRTGVIDILIKMGAHIEIENRREVSGEPVADICVKYSDLSGIEIGEDLILRAIDEFPIVCVAAAKARGTTKITGAAELRVKESDRIAAMATVLQKMGVSLEELEDGLIIEGEEELSPAEVDSYGDHRIAMSMIVAGLTIKGETTVTDTDCVNTSFPGFMERMKKLIEK